MRHICWSQLAVERKILVVWTPVTRKGRISSFILGSDFAPDISAVCT
jgi:hypothetical protein